MYYLNPSLLYLAPVAALVCVCMVFANYKRKTRVHSAYAQSSLINSTSSPLSSFRYATKGIFASLACACLVLALCRPVMDDGTKTIAQGSVDVIAVVDVSRSMAAMDYEGKVPQSVVATRLIEDGRQFNKIEDTGTRLEMVRNVMLNHLLPALDSNQLGLVSYAGEAFPQAFLTRDTSALHWVVDRGLTISSAPGEGSDIAKGLELAIAMFDADSEDSRERILVLFSDGGNTTQEQEKFAQFYKDIKSRNVKFIVVATGNVMPSKIPVSKLAVDDDFARGLLENGKRWYEVNGEIERTGTNLTFLQSLANKAGAQFIHLQDTADLDLLKLVGKSSMVQVAGTQELFPLALLASLAFLLLAHASTHSLNWRIGRKP